MVHREPVHARSSRDPIAELLERVRVHDLPSDAWLARWSAGGRDPVTAAWEASLDYGAMWTLLAMIQRLPDYRRLAEAPDQGPYGRGSRPGPTL